MINWFIHKSITKLYNHYYNGTYTLNAGRLTCAPVGSYNIFLFIFFQFNNYRDFGGTNRTLVKWITVVIKIEENLRLILYKLSKHRKKLWSTVNLNWKSKKVKIENLINN